MYSRPGKSWNLMLANTCMFAADMPTTYHSGLSEMLQENTLNYDTVSIYHDILEGFLHVARPFFSYNMSIGSFRVNSTNGSQVTVSNIAQKIPKITLFSIMKACQILGCNSEYFWRYSLSNFLFCIAFLPSRLKC